MKGITFIEIDGEYFFQNLYELKIHIKGNTNEQRVREECEDVCEDILKNMVRVGDIE